MYIHVLCGGFLWELTDFSLEWLWRLRLCYWNLLCIKHTSESKIIIIWKKDEIGNRGSFIKYDKLTLKYIRNVQRKIYLCKLHYCKVIKLLQMYEKVPTVGER